MNVERITFNVFDWGKSDFAFGIKTCSTSVFPPYSFPICSFTKTLNWIFCVLHIEQNIIWDCVLQTQNLISNSAKIKKLGSDLKRFSPPGRLKLFYTNITVLGNNFTRLFPYQRTRKSRITWERSWNFSHLLLSIAKFTTEYSPNLEEEYIRPRISLITTILNPSKNVQ